MTQTALVRPDPSGTLVASLRLAEAFGSEEKTRGPVSQQETLPFPGLLRKEALEAGNPLATYAAMLDLEPQYRQSKVFAGIYPEIRYNFEEFLGFPFAGQEAMSLPLYRRKSPSVETPIPASYRPESALSVIEREARKTRIVVLGEEHHLPQTRSLYEALLRVLWRQGYRYLAAETFAEKVMAPDFDSPDYQSGYYLLDPVFASAIRVAREMGYKLVAYDTKDRGPSGDSSFRDRTQAENIKARTFDLDPLAKVFVIAGRGHASEETAHDGWTPMASVLKRLTGIDPLTLYAPTMSERQTLDEEDPFYRYATSRGLIDRPTIFANQKTRHLLGTAAFDAYVFWPRTKIVDGRPDWMVRTIGRSSVPIPTAHLRAAGLRLVQAFREGALPTSVPADQIVLTGLDKRHLMLAPGRYWIRTIDRHGTVLASSRLAVRK